ncbi:MAG: LysR family transcriptional regulator [Hyphomonadaceae bacterium]
MARRGSFAAVARDHDIEPSQVSRAISQLEADLGFRLFQRSTRRLSVSEAGALYLQRAETLLEGLDAARSDALAISAEPAGMLRLTTSVAFGAVKIVPLLRAFQARYPKVALDLLFTDSTLDLVADRVDLAIRLAPTVRADVITSKLMDVRYRVVASPEYVMSAGALDTPDALTQRRCLLFDQPAFRKAWRFRDAHCNIVEVTVAGDLLFTSAYALFAAVKEGLGPALLPDWLVAKDILERRLVDLTPRHEASASNFDSAAWLLYPSR